MATLTSNLFFGRGDQDLALDVVEGTWPTDMEGAAFIVGPDKREPKGHWFNGPGLVLKIEVSPDADGRVATRQHVLRTPAQRLRERAPWLFGQRWVLDFSPLGVTNLANTNLQPFEGRLFVGYDAGRPAEIDPETLEFLTFVGSHAEWVSAMPGPVEPMVSVAAHPGPAFDEGALYFANYAAIPPGPTETWLARWPLDGEIRRWRLVGMSAFESIHDVKATRDYVLIGDLPFSPDPLLGRTRRSRNQDYAQVWIVRKRDLEAVEPGGDVPVREVRVPVSAGHIAVDYENPDGEITFYLHHAPTLDLSLAIDRSSRSRATGLPIDPAFEGLITLEQQPSMLGRYRVDAESGKLLERAVASDPEILWGALLWTQNLHREDSLRRTRNIFQSSLGFDPELVTEAGFDLYREFPHATVPMESLPETPIPGALARFDLDRMEIADAFVFDAGRFAQPPTFVPRRSCTHDLDGYVLALVHQEAPKEVQVFDAADLAAGPVARASAPGFNPPLMLHSCWMPARQGPRPSDYRISWGRDLRENVGAIPGALARIARSALGSR